MTLKADGTNGILQQYDYQVLTTGFTYTFAAGTTVLVINPAGTLATGTITFPAAPVDGMTCTFSSTQQITALTLSGNGKTIVSAVTALPANQATTYVYRLSNTTWYPMSTVATNTLTFPGATSGVITLAAPAVAGTNTATLPVATGELSMLGTTGQTWTVLTGSRVVGTTYTNSTGKPIFILVTGYVNTGAQTITFTVNGATVFQYNTAVGTNARGPLYTIVPVGATYAVSGFNTLEYWSELR